jgi:membrane protein DedA with SNARE-associated domain
MIETAIYNLSAKCGSAEKHSIKKVSLSSRNTASNGAFFRIVEIYLQRRRKKFSEEKRHFVSLADTSISLPLDQNAIMLEYAVEFIQGLPPLGVLAFVCFITLLENVFPPSPSDTILVFCGTLIGLGTVGFAPMIASATLGSVLGFLAMYWVGERYGVQIIESKRFRFLPVDGIQRAEDWFRRYGFWVIVANRFLSGTRAVISMVAGIAKMPLGATTLLSAVSAAVWNAILLGAGAMLGKNWLKMDEYLQLYGKVLLIILVAALVCFGLYRLWRKRAAES